MSEATSGTLVSVRIKSERAKNCSFSAWRRQIEGGRLIMVDRHDPEVPGHHLHGGPKLVIGWRRDVTTNGPVPWAAEVKSLSRFRREWHATLGEPLESPHLFEAA